jgi:hypothetical protein
MVLLSLPISHVSVQIEANHVQDIFTNWWGSPAEQIIKIGTSETPCTARESGSRCAWALEEAHRNPACRDASYRYAAILVFNGLSPTLLFTVTDAASDSSSVPMHAYRRR